VLNQPPGSNIQHILEDIEFDLEDLVGMKGDNMELTTAKEGVARAQPKPLFLFPEVGTISQALTPKRPQSLTLAGIELLG
jgi:hypothetical protein